LEKLAEHDPGKVAAARSAFSILPIVQVESRIAFATKITAMIVIANAIGIALFRGSTRYWVESL